MDDERRLIEKLRKIEALFSRPGTAGEREAARAASGRVQQRLDALRASEETEYKISLPDAWARSLLVALLRRDGISPYRYRGQRKTTVMLRASKRYMDEELWPEFRELQKTLHQYLHDVTQRVIAKAIHDDLSEPGVRQEIEQLPHG